MFLLNSQVSRSTATLHKELLLGAFPAIDVCIDYLSLRFIHSVTTAKHTIHLSTIGFGKREVAFQEQKTTLSIIHSLLILYNVYGHSTILPQELNWSQWKSVAHSHRSMAETKHNYRYNVMRWSSPKHYWHVTLRLYIIAKRTAMDSQPLFPQLSMLYVHTCIKQMTLWRWTNTINSKIYFHL